MLTTRNFFDFCRKPFQNKLSQCCLFISFFRAIFMRAKDWKWIFGLSIDEELCWVAARIDPNSQDCSYKSEPSMVVRLADLRDSNAPVALNQVLSKGLNQIKKEAGHVFDGAVSIGVSSIGLVDTSRNRLVSIARKNWIKDKEKDQFIIDFNSLFAPLVGNRKIPIGTQNDATAKCLAEYACQDKNDRVDNLFYAMFSEGVNGGLVYKHAPYCYSISSRAWTYIPS